IDFFFSSRRRHTRSKRDWSSDVCSSDLIFGISVLSMKRVPCFYHATWTIRIYRRCGVEYALCHREEWGGTAAGNRTGGRRDGTIAQVCGIYPGSNEDSGNRGILILAITRDFFRKKFII